MAKGNSYVFLPACIYAWGGIEYWLREDRSRMKRGGSKYPEFYNRSFPSTVCTWVMRRLARDGRTSVQAANSILERVANRYSGKPGRTFEANKIEGMGVVVLNDNGSPVASVSYSDVDDQCFDATEEAKQFGVTHSDLETHMLWRPGSDKYEELKRCRWCDIETPFKASWVKWNGSIRCNRRDCRRMDYLQFKPQSRGGIELTPRQRQAIPREAWDTQRAINYLALVAKEKKRGIKPNHDVR